MVTIMQFGLSIFDSSLKGRISLIISTVQPRNLLQMPQQLPRKRGKPTMLVFSRGYWVLWIRILRLLFAPLIVLQLFGII
ncbi:hypothetical protein LINGRAHAP2_LOCUS30724 [Linum grandiflorum]